MNDHGFVLVMAALSAVPPLAVLGVVLLGVKLYRRGRRLRGQETQTAAAPGAFRRAGPLLTPTEALFYPVLRRAAGSCPVLCKVRLCDVAEPTGQDGRQWGLVMRQHVDFVVVDPATWRVLAAVELDDDSHRRREAQYRDGIKGAALAAAGVPLLRISAAAHYDAGALAARLTPVIAGAGLAAQGGPAAVRV